MLELFGTSKTLGEPLGEKVDTSDLREETLVVFVLCPQYQTYENDSKLLNFIFSY